MRQTEGLNKFQCDFSVKTSTVVTFVAQLTQLQLQYSEDVDSLLIRGQELLTRRQEAGEAVAKTPLERIGPPWAANAV